MNNFYDNIKNQYPYGEFPSQYTINGQNELKARLNNPVSVQETPPQNNFPNNNSPLPPVQTQQNGAFNMESLLPLLLGGMSDKNLDKKSLLKALLPANSSIPPQLFDMLLNGKTKKNDTATASSSSTNVINTYKKIN